MKLNTFLLSSFIVGSLGIFTSIGIDIYLHFQTIQILSNEICNVKVTGHVMEGARICRE